MPEQSLEQNSETASVVKPGEPANVTLYGRNLPGGTPSEFTVDGQPLQKLAVTIPPPKDANASRSITGLSRVPPPVGIQDGFDYELAGPNGKSNSVRLFFAREPLHVRKSPGNMTAETAEPMIFEDIQGDPRYQEWTHSEASKKIGYRFFAVFPIKSKGRCLGCIVCNGH